MAFGVSDDELLLIFMPILAFWLYSGMYTMLGSIENLDNYMLHSKDGDEKNLISKGDVIKGVLLNQALQAFLVFLISKDGDAPSKQQSVFVDALQFLVSMAVTDTYQYFVHRFILHNKYFYPYIHSYHHRIVVPYPFGSLYSHPFEYVVIDALGATLSVYISGMSNKTSMFFFSFSTIKVVEDHCGMILPGNPFCILFENSKSYHFIHHQLYGLKYNYSQPFFVMWDKILGTHMPYSLEKKEGGGIEVRPLLKKSHKEN